MIAIVALGRNILAFVQNDLAGTGWLGARPVGTQIFCQGRCDTCECDQDHDQIRDVSVNDLDEAGWLQHAAMTLLLG